MDRKHREYCIRLGNPYIKEESFNENFRNIEQLNSSWMSETELPNEDWIKNTKKFTN